MLTHPHYSWCSCSLISRQVHTWHINNSVNQSPDQFNFSHGGVVGMGSESWTQGLHAYLTYLNQSCPTHVMVQILYLVMLLVNIRLKNRITSLLSNSLFTNFSNVTILRDISNGSYGVPYSNPYYGKHIICSNVTG